MSTTPAELKYTQSHEWVRDNGDGTVTVGITDHAQQLLGDLVFVELPEIGAQASAGKEVAVVESVKAASDVYSPLDGEIIATNSALQESPEQVNDAPYDTGWLFKLKLHDAGALAGLMSAADYATQADEAH